MQDAAPPLPGRWIHFGDDVVHIAAHPSRPWIALVRHAANTPPTVEHRDLTTRETLSLTDVPDTGQALVWVGDRIALIATTHAAHAAYVDTGSGLVDVVYLHAPIRRRAVFTQRFARGWEVLLIGDARWVVAHLALDAGQLTVRETPVLTGPARWHPDGRGYARAVWADGDAPVFTLVDDGTERTAPLPPEGPEWRYNLLGWSAPDRLVVLSRNPFSMDDGSARLWTLDTTTLTLDDLGARIATELGPGYCALSPDGSTLALDVGYDRETDASLVFVDAQTGEALDDPLFHDLRDGRELLWVDDTTLVVAVQPESAERLDLVVVGGALRWLYHYSVTVDDWVMEGDRDFVQRFDTKRLVLSVSDRVGRVFVSDAIHGP